MNVPRPTDPHYQHIASACMERTISSREFPGMSAGNIWMLGSSVIPAGAAFAFWRPRPDFHQVLVVTGGRGRGLIDNQWRQLEIGQAYITSANAPHAYHADGAWEICWCIIKPSAFPHFQGMPRVIQTNPRLWQNLLSGALEESLDKDPALLMQTWLELILHHCARIMVDGVEHRLWQLWGEVSNHLDANWDIAKMAKIAGMSRETLRQRCQQELGISPIAHVTRLRIRRAVSLLESGIKLEATSQMVGYGNVFAFSVAFKRVMGLPPSEYRKRLGTGMR